MSLWLDTVSFSATNYSISNSILGQIGTTELAIFDLSIRQGKSAVRQTIVGFRSPEREQSSATGTVGPSHFELAGQWIIGHIPQRALDASDLDDWCKELLNLCQTLNRESSEPPDRATQALGRLYQEF